MENPDESPVARFQIFDEEMPFDRAEFERLRELFLKRHSLPSHLVGNAGPLNNPTAVASDS